MSVPSVFDLKALHRQRRRRAASLKANTFLLDEVATRLLDRLDDIRREFVDVLDLGSRHGVFGRALAARRPGVQIVSADPTPELVAEAPGARVVASFEALPFRDASFDAAFSVLSLHAVNDLPGTLAQLRRLLRPDGLLLLAFVGGETLTELRQALMEGELQVTGGASPRVTPFVDVRDLGALLQRAGFALPVADVDRLTLTYAEPLALLAEMRAAGEANVLAERNRKPLRRDVLMRARELYLARHADAHGRIRATVDVLFATGWVPHPSQQQPARRGSGMVNLAEAMGVDPEILEGRARADDKG